VETNQQKQTQTKRKEKHLIPALRLQQYFRLFSALAAVLPLVFKRP